MTKPEIKVSVNFPVAADGWKDTATLYSGRTQELYFEITVSGGGEFKIEFPVADTLASETALVSVEGWKGNFDMSVCSPDQGITCKKLVTANRYYINIAIPKDPKEVVFNLKLKLNTISAKNGMAVSKVKYFDDDDDQIEFKAFTVILEKKIEQPKIKSFTINKAILLPQDTYDLEWDIEEAEVVTLTTPTGIETVKLKDSKRKLEISADFLHRITAKNGDFIVTKDILVKYHDRTEVCFIKNFNDQIKAEIADLLTVNLMNLVKIGDKLYALLLIKTKENTDAYFFDTKDGINWYKSAIGSFNHNDGVNVPLLFAGSPIVYLGTKIYLIGGSKFDPNFRSNDVYSYDLKKEGTGWQKETSKPTFSERMGHAVVVYDNEIWLLGGIGDERTFKDIHTYSPISSSWKKLDEKKEMDHALCMHTAVVEGNILTVYGGCARMISEFDQRLIDSMSKNLASTNPDEKWKPEWVANPKKRDDIIESELVSCVFGATLNERFIFTVFERTELGRMAFEIKNKSLDKLSPKNGFLLTNTFTGSQTVSFNNVIFFCSNSDDGTLETTLPSYFIYHSITH
ncbi:hypothetical protein FA048_16485 [Pedobacter polaris]|uniref:Uncharacterized protein n=1 Tax=Pedobacter polaris TaxID=2571273 RepID=A0A4U1CJS1_9SPHI|nr:kelch repeat-containing protein [Pedobacter polaris]TKC06794.1 hypothetical protein FA048_16485 [Pedobacter polaris]